MFFGNHFFCTKGRFPEKFECFPYHFWLHNLHPFNIVNVFDGFLFSKFSNLLRLGAALETGLNHLFLSPEQSWSSEKSENSPVFIITLVIVSMPDIGLHLADLLLKFCDLGHQLLSHLHSSLHSLNWPGMMLMVMMMMITPAMASSCIFSISSRSASPGTYSFQVECDQTKLFCLIGNCKHVPSISKLTPPLSFASPIAVWSVPRPSRSLSPRENDNDNDDGLMVMMMMIMKKCPSLNSRNALPLGSKF